MIKKNFFIPILAIAMISAAVMSSQDVFAHNDGTDSLPCTGKAAGSGVTLFRNDVAFTGDVFDGETITAKFQLFTGGVDPCAFDGGDGGEFTGEISLRNPQGTFQVVQASYGCVGGTTNTDDQIGGLDCAGSQEQFFSTALTYVVDCKDIP